MLNQLLIGSICVIAIFLSARGIYFISWPKRIQGWNKVKCNILDARIDERQELALYARIQRYYPYVKYEYVIDGVNYISDKISRNAGGEWSYDRNQTKDFLNALSKCGYAYVNSDNPHEAYLYNKLLPKSFTHYSAVLVSGVVLSFIGILLIRFLL